MSLSLFRRKELGSGLPQGDGDDGNFPGLAMELQLKRSASSVCTISFICSSVALPSAFATMS